MLKATHTMGKWFVLNAIHHSCGLDGTKRPLTWLLLLFNKHRKDHLQIQTHSEMHKVSEISRFSTCSETCPTRWRVAYFLWQKIKIILLFSVIILACVVYSISYMFLIPLQNLCPVCCTYTWLHVCITCIMYMPQFWSLFCCCLSLLRFCIRVLLIYMPSSNKYLLYPQCDGRNQVHPVVTDWLVPEGNWFRLVLDT